MRKEKLIDVNKELELINKIGNDLSEAGYTASNSIIVTVSTDYSSIVGQILRHQLSDNGEIVDGFGIDVPYPDESWDNDYHDIMIKDFRNHSYGMYGKNIILVEAGVIRGSNYEHVVNSIYKWFGINNNIVTVALFENISSKWQSNFVGEYYDDEFEDLTFWWERENNHWK
jgi:hypothetical protein